MTFNPFNFDELINPISTNEFLNDYWEKKPLLLQNRGECYGPLFSLKDADFLISTLHNTSTKWFRLMNNKNEVSTEHYVNDHQTHIIDKKKVIYGFNKGNTIVLNALQRRFEPLGKFCENLEEIFGHQVGVNMYFTPASAQGFAAHYDPHSVFILQIDGEKLWRLYHQHAQFPIANNDAPFLDTLPSPSLEIVLKPGDLLYIPRGLVHEALTENTFSLHLTAGIHVTTWIDLIKEIALQESFMGEALPVGMLSNKNSDLINETDLIDKLAIDKDKIHKAVEKLKTKFQDVKSKSFYSELSALKESE